MPRRFIQESCRRSKTLDGLSAEAERLFWRLITVADDYGRFPADPRELFSSCFPLRVGHWKPARVAKWYSDLESAGLVVTYRAGDHIYGQFLKFREHQGEPRADKSRYPAPSKQSIEIARTCAQARADVPVVRSSLFGTTDLDLETTTTSAPQDGAPPTSADDPHPAGACQPSGTPEDPGQPRQGRSRPPDNAFEQFWQSYPKPRRRAKFEARRAWTDLRPTAETFARIMRSLDAWKASPDWLKESGRFIPWPQKFLNKHRWEDEPEPGAQPEDRDQRLLAELRAVSPPESSS